MHHQHGDAFGTVGYIMNPNQNIEGLIDMNSVPQSPNVAPHFSNDHQYYRAAPMCYSMPMCNSFPPTVTSTFEQSNPTDHYCDGSMANVIIESPYTQVSPPIALLRHDVVYQQQNPYFDYQPYSSVIYCEEPKSDGFYSAYSPASTTASSIGYPTFFPNNDDESPRSNQSLINQSSITLEEVNPKIQSVQAIFDSYRNILLNFLMSGGVDSELLVAVAKILSQPHAFQKVCSWTSNKWEFKVHNSEQFKDTIHGLVSLSKSKKTYLQIVKALKSYEMRKFKGQMVLKKGRKRNTYLFFPDLDPKLIDYFFN